MELNFMRELVESLSDPVVRRRIYTLADVMISIGRREGWVHDGMTRAEALKAMNAHTEEAQTRNETLQVDASLTDENTSKLKDSPQRKEIRIRLSQDEWEQISYEARKLQISYNSLARKWILEGLSRVGGTIEPDKN